MQTLTAQDAKKIMETRARKAFKIERLIQERLLVSISRSIIVVIVGIGRCVRCVCDIAQSHALVLSLY